MSSGQAGNSSTTDQEYVIRVPKNHTKKYHVMRFNSVLNVDFSKWNQVKMERENNMKEYRGLDDEMPKFGAGSEFGRDQREEARRKKFGIVTKKYRPEDQPWILKVGGKTGKKFKGIREGGVGENAAYYVFTHAPDGAIEAFPLREWYNFQPIQRYKALSAEEAEQEFGRRNKVMNYFSLMLRKRLRNDEDGEIEELDEGRRGGGGKSGKGELKISEMDDWVDSDGGEDNSDDDDVDKEKDENESKDKKGKGKGKKGKDAKEKAKKKRKGSDDEAFEESDDGDEEGREVDYISDSSDSEIDLDENVKDSMKGVAEEDALRKLLTSDEEDEEEREGGEDEDGDEDKGDGDKGEDGEGDGKKGGADSDGEDDKKGSSSSKKKKGKVVKKDTKKKDPSSILNDSSSNYSSDSSDSEIKKKGSKGKETNRTSKNKGILQSGNSSRAATPTKGAADGPLSSASSSSSTAGGDGNKRKADPDGLSGGSAKKPRMEGPLSSVYSDSGITEEAVRRYLMRKPMTTTELLQKFKSKKTGLSSEQLVNVMTQILKRINPIKQFIKGKMYLSIKA